MTEYEPTAPAVPDDRAGASRESVEGDTWRRGNANTQDVAHRRRGFWGSFATQVAPRRNRRLEPAE